LNRPIYTFILFCINVSVNVAKIPQNSPQNNNNNNNNNNNK